MSVIRPFVILGGGVAGLAAGYYARRAGAPVTIFEGACAVGGNARTIAHGAFRFDTGAHRFHDRYPDVTADVKALLGPDLVEVSAPSQILFDGRFVDFPLTPFNLLSALGPLRSLAAARDLITGRLTPLPSDPSFEAVALRAYGRTIADLFLLGYSEKLWGVPCSQLLPSVAGKRLQGLSFQLLVRELLKKSGRSPHLEGRFYYPTQGIGMIVDRLADEIGRDRIALGSRITRIEHDGQRVRAIEVNGHQRVDVLDAHLVNTLPPAAAVAMLDPAAPPEVLAAARSLRFRHVVLVTLMINRESISSDATIYFPQPDQIFTRGSEPRNRSRALSPAGQTSMSLEIPCWGSDPIWKTGDAEIVTRCRTDLVATGLVRDSEIVDAVVHRIPSAYPVLELGSDHAMAIVRDHLARLENVHISGRVGAFAYVHIHDLIRSGREIVGRVAASGR